MKKILLCLFTVILLVSCSSDQYTLTGSFDNPDYDGTLIQIKRLEGTKWVSKDDKTTVENRSFEIKGNATEPTIAYLSYHNEQKQWRGEKIFVLENRNLKVHFDNDGNISITGSKQNKLIDNFEKKLTGKEPEENVQSYVKFSEKHINKPAGQAVFIDSYYYMSVSEKESIISLMNEDTKSNEKITSIIKRTEAETKVAIGKKFTDFRLNDSDGNLFSLSELVGKTDYVLIDFWASWCPPCVRSFPELTAFYNNYKGSKLEILGVSLDVGEEAWKPAIEKYKLSWIHVSDLKGWDNAAAKLYAVSAIPCTILINKEGTIMGRNMKLTEIEELLK
ncbi:AhpC/TSA family protein [Paludibacter sp. 221]|uniref:TlpA disulfide reductase family protein n=1 Tax=Paludibacter sp. 221 TaxID=2302939 RepID=UPI0013D378C5|nr:TlpA disulfide reductase family protein [Paludibacter sp. 221]NDV47542.1 AhpC/TSA family protein [Paludibacter sp. 221]